MFSLQDVPLLIAAHPDTSHRDVSAPRRQAEQNLGERGLLARPIRWVPSLVCRLCRILMTL
jgi:hypothetical protein